MTNTALTTEIIYRAAGSPPTISDVDGACALCGGVTLPGILFPGWVRDSFMDYDKLKSGTIICSACQFSCDDRSTILQDKLGRDKPQRMRNYSHFVVNGRWSAFHKGQKAEMLALLASAPCEVAVLALSGQKHILFRARVGWWQVEEQAVFPDQKALARTTRLIGELLELFSKREIQAGCYPQYRIQKFGLSRWRSLERELATRRQSAIFHLALWLAQKEEDSDGGAIREGEADS